MVNGANIDVGIIDATTCVDDANGFVVPLVDLAEIQYRLSFIVLLLMLFMLLLIYL